MNEGENMMVWKVLGVACILLICFFGRTKED